MRNGFALTHLEPRGGRSATSSPRLGSSSYASHAARAGMLIGALASGDANCCRYAIYGIGRASRACAHYPRRWRPTGCALEATLENGISVEVRTALPMAASSAGISHREPIWEIPLNSQLSAASDRGRKHGRYHLGRVDEIVWRSSEDPQLGPKDVRIRVRVTLAQLPRLMVLRAS